MNFKKYAFSVILTVFLLNQLTSAANLQTCSSNWEITKKSVALKNNGNTVWQFNYGKETSKPFFHPIALTDGTVLTVDRPADHPWHHGLWFCWKYINGVNFWEENPKTGKSRGITDWSNTKIITKPDNSAIITMKLTYNHKDKKPILSEKRTIRISPPCKKGVYYIDWHAKFTACSDEDVELNRTPLPGEPGGKSWGGYAGLSVRFNNNGNKWTVSTEKGPIAFEKGRYRKKAKSMEFSGVFDGKTAGITMLDHPDNLNYPTPWYAIEDRTMKFFTPALICFKPHTIPSGETLELKYRLIVHPQKWDAKDLESNLEKFKAETKQPK